MNIIVENVLAIVKKYENQLLNENVFDSLIDMVNQNKLPVHMKVGGCRGITYNKYWTNELISGVQKYIRRGMLDKAIYCAVEMTLFAVIRNRGEGPTTKLLNRLLVIVLEDIGIANIALIEKVMDDYKIARDTQSKRSKYLKQGALDAKFLSYNATICECICRMVELQCKSPHGRFVSHYRGVFKSFYDTRQKVYRLARKYYSKTILPIYDYISAQQISTKEDLIAQFYKAKEAKFGSVERYSLFYWGYKFEIEYGNLIYDEKSFKEYNKILSNKWEGDAALPWQLSLVLLTNREIVSSKTNKSVVNWEDYYHKNLTGEKIELDTFVTDDKHCNRFIVDGRKKFALIGSVVKNESELITTSEIEMAFKSLYIDCSLSDDEIEKRHLKKESDTFTFRARVQLVCGASKTDTYFAYQNERAVFVKGPFRSLDGPLIQCELTKMKKHLGLPFLDMEILQLVPDLLEEPHRGFRGCKAIDKDKAYPFLVVDDLTFKEIDIIPCQIKKYSNDDRDIEVVDFSQAKTGIPLKSPLPYENRKMMKSFVLNVLFRWLFGVSDMALRNFIRDGDVVYSVDEDVVFRWDSFENGIRLDVNLDVFDIVSKWKIDHECVDKLIEITNSASKSTYEKLERNLSILKNREKLGLLFVRK